MCRCCVGASVCTLVVWNLDWRIPIHVCVCVCVALLCSLITPICLITYLAYNVWSYVVSLDHESEL